MYIYLRCVFPSLLVGVGVAGCASSEPGALEQVSSVKLAVTGADFSGNSVRICGSRPSADPKYGCDSDIASDSGACPCFDFNADGSLITPGGAPALTGLCPSINVPQADWTFSYAIYSAPGCSGTQLNDGAHNLTCFDSHDIASQAHPDQSVEPLAPGLNINHVLCLTTDATKDWSFTTCSIETTAADTAIGQLRLDCGCAPAAGTCDCGPGGVTAGDLESKCSFEVTTCDVLCEGPIPRNAIGDRVWFDQNFNGLQDPGEPGLPGAVLTLLYADTREPVTIGADGAMDPTTTTDEDGHYLFDNLLPGNYIVQAQPIFALMTHAAVTTTSASGFPPVRLVIRDATAQVVLDQFLENAGTGCILGPFIFSIYLLGTDYTAEIVDASGDPVTELPPDMSSPTLTVSVQPTYVTLQHVGNDPTVDSAFDRPTWEATVSVTGQVNRDIDLGVVPPLDTFGCP